jgi:YD repeat-containing protein
MEEPGAPQGPGGGGQEVVPGSPVVAGGGLDPSDPSYVGPQEQGGGGGPINLTVPLTIDVPSSSVHVEPATVHVPAPNISVNVPSVEVQERRVEFTRDDKGRIVSADVTDGKKRG